MGDNYIRESEQQIKQLKLFKQSTLARTAKARAAECLVHMAGVFH